MNTTIQIRTVILTLPNDPEASCFRPKAISRTCCTLSPSNTTLVPEYFEGAVASVKACFAAS